MTCQRIGPGNIYLVSTTGFSSHVVEIMQNFLNKLTRLGKLWNFIASGKVMEFENGVLFYLFWRAVNYHPANAILYEHIITIVILFGQITKLKIRIQVHF